MHNYTPTSTLEFLHTLQLEEIVDSATIDLIYQEFQPNKESLQNYLLRKKILSNTELLSCLSKHFNLPYIEFTQLDLTKLKSKIIKNPLIPANIIYQYKVLPLSLEHSTLTLGISDPTNYTAVSALSFLTGYKIKLTLVAEVEVENIISEIAKQHQLGEQLETMMTKIIPYESSPEANELLMEEEPVSQFIESLLTNAFANHVSDIHIEPKCHNYKIRFRRDGILYETTELPSYLALRIVTCLKVSAQLNIAEQRLPQDGRIHLPNHEENLRISTCPLLYGEKVVIRILNHLDKEINLHNLGLSTWQKTMLTNKLTKSQGLIIVTGPTGSGKTFSLYSALNYLDALEKNISTIEDPIEIELPHINQIAINPKIGLDFNTILRALLRQDPDVIMVGEIRDLETAETALLAAQTGHLVLTTLHTKSAIHTIDRLRGMGIENSKLKSSISLIIAQRLLRKLCEFCKIKTNFTYANNDWMGYKPIGCEHCLQGYSGRMAIFEILPLTENVNLENHTELKSILGAVPLNSLKAAAFEKLMLGLTSFEEYLKLQA